MGLLDKVFRKEKKPRGETPPEPASADGPECSVCGQPGAEKKFTGQYFHKKCLRKTRKMAKGMV